LRRQTVLGGVTPAGSGCASRLDPLALPVRFTATDAVADGLVRHVEIAQERVRVKRSVRGITISINVPTDGYLGVSLRMLPSDDGCGERVTVSLAHRDPGLSVTLFEATDNYDVIAEWQLWSRVLALPLLIVDGEGVLRPPFPSMGMVQVGKAGPRRRRRNAVKRRRPSFPLRRRAVTTQPTPVIRREREIIARN
jgi:hypothetical protein